MTNCR